MQHETEFHSRNRTASRTQARRKHTSRKALRVFSREGKASVPGHRQYEDLPEPGLNVQPGHAPGWWQVI